eukprot:g11864.t1
MQKVAARAFRPASRQTAWRAAVWARKAAQRAIDQGRSSGALLRLARSAAREAVDGKARRAKVKRAKKRKRPKTSGTQASLEEQAGVLAQEAISCREAWDAKKALELLQRAASCMESFEKSRKLLQDAARNAIQVLDLEHPKTQRLVAEPLRRLGVKPP